MSEQYSAVFQPYQVSRFTVTTEGVSTKGETTYKLSKAIARLTFSVGSTGSIIDMVVDVSDAKGEDYSPGLRVTVKNDLKVTIEQSAKPLFGKENTSVVVSATEVSTNGDLAIAAVSVLARDYEPTFFSNKIEPASLLLREIYSRVTTTAQGKTRETALTVAEITAAFAAVNIDGRVKRLGDTPLMSFCRGAEDVMKQQANTTKETVAPTKA